MIYFSFDVSAIIGRHNSVPYPLPSCARVHDIGRRSPEATPRTAQFLHLCTSLDAHIIPAPLQGCSTRETCLIRDWRSTFPELSITEIRIAAIKARDTCRYFARPRKEVRLTTRGAIPGSERARDPFFAAKGRYREGGKGSESYWLNGGGTSGAEIRYLIVVLKSLNRRLFEHVSLEVFLLVQLAGIELLCFIFPWQVISFWTRFIFVFS